MKKILLVSLMCCSTFYLSSCKNSDTSTNNNKNSSSSKVDSSSSESIYSPKEDEKVHLVILAGQSGASGKALVNDLEGNQKTPNYDVDIMCSGLHMEELDNIPEYIDETIDFSELKPGFGDYPSEFGPELGIGETLASRYPKVDDNYRSVIVKYTGCGSTFTEHWYSKSLYNDSNFNSYLNKDQQREFEGSYVGPLTSNLYQLIDYTVALLEADGYEVAIDGAAFVHGEQDAKYDENMEIYEKALTYFIKDLREYVGNDKLPFVVTEALTNSAKHSNKLRDIQKKVSDLDKYTTLVTNEGLYTNTFEPWHFGAKSNMVLGNRIAAEIISYNDTRVIDLLSDEVIDVPYGAKVELPKYLEVSFDNGYEGYLKVEEYSNYDPNTLGEQEVTFKAKTGLGIVEESLIINVTDDVTNVDGKLEEYSNIKKNPLPNDLGNLYVVKGQEGLFISCEINDNEVLVDGEKWHEGDMGQRGQNDDLRIFVTDSEAAKRKTICLSSVNLLRVYDSGVSMDDSDSELISKNLVYKKQVKNYEHRVNLIDGKGLTFELFIAYQDLDINNVDSLKLCFNYSDVSLKNDEKEVIDNYYSKSITSSKCEENIDNYFNISELI